MCQALRRSGAGAILVSPSDPRRAHLCLRVARVGLRVYLCLWPGPRARAGVPGVGRGLPPHPCPPSVQRKVYLVEAVLVSFLRSVVEAGSPAQAQAVVRQVLDLLWLFMEVRLLTAGLGPGGQAPQRWGEAWGGFGKGPMGGRPGAWPPLGRRAVWPPSPRTTRCRTASSS